MELIDMHCDTILKLYENGNKENLNNNNFQVDLNKLKKAGAKAQFFALFVELTEIDKLTQTPFTYCKELLNRFKKEMEDNKDIIRLARNYDELQENFKSGKISSFLTIEEGEALEGSVKNLEYFYNEGVRLVTLTWNFENSLGFPNCKRDFMDRGLKEKGIEVVSKMNELGMLIDVSHLSDGGFYDVLRYSNKPFVASHSNARVITNHPRNLTDDMIKALADKGGVMGLNFCPAFLGHNEKAKIEYMINHLKYIRNIGGIDVMAMGTDFDGIYGDIEINHIGEMDKLLYTLEKEGFKEDEIEKIWHKNAERVIREVLR
ncbi:dipeptidase [Hathewaya histolytica]|uniref:dipeptidase n=1 Tax=Hathewaya histolytica TaxID=1498 RepID=UPI003B6809B6